MKKLCIIFVVVLLFSYSAFAVSVSARSAILYEPETGTVLFEKNANEERAIASTTKILTAVVALENAKLTDTVTVPKSCVGIEGTSMYLQEGEKLTVSDLLYGTLLRSGNDAATTLAYFVSRGDVSRFVDMMNETAKRIGMKNSRFKNPSGLPDKGHFSTAYDMAKLSAYALTIPEFSEIVSTKEKAVAGRSLSNHNKLLRMYSGANGVKTGFTKEAGRCLVSSAERDGMSLVAVTLSAPDDWNDHINMLDYGFGNYSVYRESLHDAEGYAVPVVNGENDSVSAAIASEVSVLYNKNEAVVKTVFLPRFVYAPVSRGDVLGKIEYSIGGKVCESVSVVCCDTVAENKKENFFERILKFFRKA